MRPSAASCISPESKGKTCEPSPYPEAAAQGTRCFGRTDMQATRLSLADASRFASTRGRQVPAATCPGCRDEVGSWHGSFSGCSGGTSPSLTTRARCARLRCNRMSALLSAVCLGRHTRLALPVGRQHLTCIGVQAGGPAQVSPRPAGGHAEGGRCAQRSSAPSRPGSPARLPADQPGQVSPGACGQACRACPAGASRR